MKLQSLLPFFTKKRTKIILKEIKKYKILYNDINLKTTKKEINDFYSKNIFHTLYTSESVYLETY